MKCQEDAYTTKIESGVLIVHKPSRVERVPLTNLTRILVESDYAHLGLDVWFVFEGEQEDELCSFPLGAIGYNAVLDELRKRLPDFEVDGMNSAVPAQFVCWSRKSY